MLYVMPAYSKAWKVKDDGPKSITVYTEHPTTPMPVYHFLDDDGTVWEVRRTQVGIFKVPAYGSKGVGDHLQLFVPKIPLSILEEIVNKSTRQSESMHHAYIIWDAKEGYSVRWATEIGQLSGIKDCCETDDRFVVAYIHTEGEAREKTIFLDGLCPTRTGLCGVLGRSESGGPTLAFRYVCNGQFALVRPECIFSGNIRTVVWPKWG